MTALARSRDEIEAKWRAFVIDGHLPASLRPEILRSWLRVRSNTKVDPAIRTCPRAANSDDVLRRAELDVAVQVARPLVEQFARRLAPDGHVVGFFDGDGVMLALDGNHRTRDRLADVNFAPGACWAEDSAGTNGIGTALVEDRPVEVFASEHFVEAWQAWTCASVPVRSCGRVVGVVDITSPWASHHPALLLTVEALGRAIEAQLDTAAARCESETLLRVAQDALRAREEFLAVASHELRTPLTPLQLKIQRLQRLLARTGGRSLDTDQLAAVLEGADGHLRRLVDFIDGLTHLPRDQQPLQLVLECTDLGALVRGIVERQRRELERRDCECTVYAPRQVISRWDPGRLAQAFSHLLVNAMKYAPGVIEIEVEAEGDVAHVRVRDHGPGIAPEIHERIFQRFERNTSYRNVAGFGLGLAAVRQIVEAHGGAVRLDSTVGGGSTFVVELPLRSGTTAPP